MGLDPQQHIRMIGQQELAPALVEDAVEEYGAEPVAEVCAAVEEVLREECQERGLGKHAGQAACYMVVNRLADAGEDEDGGSA